jgi:CheY-like chemotaxis protein
LAEFHKQETRLSASRSRERSAASPLPREAGVPPASANDEGRGGAKLTRIPDTKRARILVVDDNDDVRQMMAVALQIHGYFVAEAADAEEALGHLQGGLFDVVLSDYELPDKTGATMLREASRAGLLGSATALIVTAHTQPDDADGFEIIRKPINLDRLMSQVERVLGASGKVRAVAPPPADGGAAACDLVLYVSAGSAASVKARRSMESTLRAFAGSAIRYVVCDVAEEPVKAEEDQIVFTPTLVKRSPGPRAWVLGDLADAAVVIDLLKICGLKPST